MNKKNPALLLALCSPLAFTGFNIGVRYISAHMTIFGLLFLRGCIGVLVISIFAGMYKKNLFGRNTRLLSLIGLCGFLSATGLTMAISLIPLYQALVILYLFPTFSIFLSALINGEKIRRGDILTSLLALGGCLLLTWPDEAAGLSFQMGHITAFAGSVLYALAYVLTRRLGEENSGIEPMFHYSLYCVVGSLPLAMLFGRNLGLDFGPEIAAGLALGGLGSLAQVLAYAALRWLPAFTVGVIGSLEVLGGALASYFLFSDPMNARAIIGGVIIVTIALWPRRQP